MHFQMPTGMTQKLLYHAKGPLFGACYSKKPSKHAAKCMLSFPLLLRVHIDENKSMANLLLMQKCGVRTLSKGRSTIAAYYKVEKYSEKKSAKCSMFQACLITKFKILLKL